MREETGSRRENEANTENEREVLDEGKQLQYARMLLQSYRERSGDHIRLSLD